MSGDHWLAEVLDWFDQVDQYLPGSSSLVGELLYGKVPQANDDRLHDLADAWAAARDELTSYAEHLYNAADPILEGWGGDGAATNFQQNWQQHLEDVQQGIQAYAGMADMTSGFALEIETEKFMTALNLLFLAYTLIAVIATLAVSFGASAMAAPGAFAVTREAIALAAREALEKIGSMGARLFTRDVLKNITARSVADRVAGQIFKDIIRKEMRQALTETVDAAARKALVRAAYQMRKELAEKLAAQLAKDWGAKAVGEMAAHEVVETVSKEAIEKILADTVADTFGKELVKYFVPKVVQGAIFMGGQNLIVQSVEAMAGDKSGVDLGETAMSAVQGGLMGGLMGGRSYVGQMTSGALAGASTAALADGVAVLTGNGADVNWGSDLLHGAGSGAVMAGFFHVQHGVQGFRENLSVAANHQIGQETHLLASPEAGVTGLDIQVEKTGLHIDRQLGDVSVVEHGDTTSFFDAQGRTITADQASELGYRGGDAGTATPSRPGPGTTGGTPSRDAANGASTRDGNQGRSGGATTEAPRTPEPVGDDRSATAGEPDAADREPSVGPGHDVAPPPEAGDDHGGVRAASGVDDGGPPPPSRHPDTPTAPPGHSDMRTAPATHPDTHTATAERSVAEVDPSRVKFADPPADHHQADHPSADQGGAAAQDHRGPEVSSHDPGAAAQGHDHGGTDVQGRDLGGTQAHGHDAAGGTHTGGDQAPVPIHEGALAVAVEDGGRVWTSELSADLTTHGDPAALRALDTQVSDILRAAGEPLNWIDGHPPRIEMRAEHGIDARTARHLEHLRTDFEQQGADGTPVRQPRVTVVGPRIHDDPMHLAPEIREQDTREQVPYFDAAQRAPYEVKVIDGRMYDQNEIPLHGHYVFVTEPHSERVYAMEWAEEGRLGAKHSTLLAGGDVQSAGEMLVANGRVLGLDNSSGHYVPTAEHVWTQRDVLAGKGVDVSGADIRVIGHERTPHSVARGESAFQDALEELNRPGEIDGVRRIELAPAGRHTDPDHPDATLRVTTVDGRVVEVDAGSVRDYLTATRPDGPDIARFEADRRPSTPAEDLAHQGADLLRERIEAALPTEPHRPEEPVGADGPRPTRTLADLDRALAEPLGERPLLDALDPAAEPPVDPAAAVGAARAVSDAQIHADVNASGLPADRAAQVAAALIDRRDALIGRYERAPHPDEVRRMTDALAIYTHPDMSGRELYDTLREQAYRKTVGFSTGLTVPEAARALDEAVEAEHGTPGGYARMIDDYLASPEGAAYHDDLVHLDLATSHGPHVDPESARFRAVDADAAADAGARQGRDWSPAQRDALARYADIGAPGVDSFLRSDGEAGGPGRAEAFKIQSAMRPTDVDLRLHGGLDLRDLGLTDRSGLPDLVDSHVSVKSFLRVSADERGTSVYGDVRIVMEAPAGTHAVWLGDVGERGTGDMLLAAGTDLHVLDLTRIGTDHYELRVRVDGYEDPAALAGRVHHIEPPDTHLDHGDHLHRDSDTGHSNADVWQNGGDVPQTVDEVYHVADLMDIDLTGVRIDLVTDAAQIRDLDERGLAATTPIEARGRIIRLGPAAFADTETLAATVAHEYAHVEQLRSGVRVTPENREALERQAYASERPALERLRARTEDGAHDDPVLGGESVRPRGSGGSARVGLDPGGRDRAGDDVGGRDGRPDDGGGRGLREPGRPADRTDDAVVGADDAEPGGARDGAGGRVESGEAGGVHVPRDLRDVEADPAGAEPAVRGSDDRTAPDSAVHPGSDVGVRPRNGRDVPVRHGVPAADPSDIADGSRADRPGGVGHAVADRAGVTTDDAGRRGGGQLAEAHELARPVDGAAPDHGGGPTARELEQQTLDRLNPHDRNEIVGAVDDSVRQVADDALGQLRQVADRAGGRMVGDDHHVKSAGSLARKFLKVSRVRSVESFLESIHDVIRFSMELPEDAYSGERIHSVLRELDSLGYRAEEAGESVVDVTDATNFWRPGNRFYGFNMTMREPGGHLMELQFPTERSWAAGKQTHDFYEIVRQKAFDFDTRVDAFLRILKINNDFELPEHVPADQSGLPPARQMGFAEWVGDSPDWHAYVQHLAGEGRTFDDVLADHGLTRADIPRGETTGLFDDASGAHDPDAGLPELDSGLPELDGRVPEPDGGAHVDPTGDGDLGRLFGRPPPEPEPLGEIRPGLDFRTAEPPLREGMPDDPNESFGRLHEQVSHIAEEQASLAESLRGDGKYWFAGVYHHVTRFEMQMIDDGRYTYPIMKLQEVVAFDRTFEVDMDRWLHGRFDEVEPNWRLAFREAELAPERWHALPSLEILGAMLPSMKAHIELDLPRAIAAVYERFYQANGIPFDAFKPDFDRMQPVFDDASAALLPEIADATFPGDPGQYALIQRVGFPFIYDVSQARQDAWERAGLIVSGHELGIHDQPAMQQRIEAYQANGRVFSGRGALKIAGERVRDYDWNHQPGMEHPEQTVPHQRAATSGEEPRAAADDVAGPEEYIPAADVQQAVVDRIGAHSPELASVVHKLLDDEHALNVTESLRSGALHEHVLSTIEELARGDALRPYNGDLSAFLADHPGHGPLFDHVRPEINTVTGADGVERSRLSVYVAHAKTTDEALTTGAQPSPAEAAAVRDYATRLADVVKPAVDREVASIAAEVREHTSGPVEVNSRPKNAAGLFDKVNRMAAGRPGAPGRADYQVGDIVDAVGARITVPDMDTLERLYAAVVDHFGVGDGGRIVEIDNMYASPKAKNPAYRVIPMVVAIEVDGRPYAFELQLTSLRASVAADIEHNSLYKPYIDLSPEEKAAVRRAFTEASALDQQETRDE